MNSALRLRLYRSMSYAVYAVRRPATAVRGSEKQSVSSHFVEWNNELEAGFNAYPSAPPGL